MKIAIMLFLMLPFALVAQDATTKKTQTTQDAVTPKEKLVLSDTLVFMGVDLSRVKMINSVEVDNAQALKEKHGPDWSTIDDVMCDHNFALKIDLGKKKIICKANFFDKSYLKMDSNWIVDSFSGITAAQIEREVKSYAAIPGYKLGLAFIVDVMNAPAKSVNVYGVYIDLSDNSVVKTINCIGGGEGLTSNYSKYWASAVDNAYKEFVIYNQNYVQRVRHEFKKKKKVDEPKG